ncbi:hypothetical protein [Dehalogenimonas sp. 4OHTPN]|uniref:Uncharacterized protein n=1 Tax=Dehalogenimonas sp. 4OHTPN TaxID=3166643 RepID=A0AAU8GDK9_9CHLR
MKKRIVSIAFCFALLAIMVMPTFSAADTTVTGSTASSYTISTTAQFGAMPASSVKTLTGVVTATYDSTVTVTVANTTAAYVTGCLTKLEYMDGVTSKITITAPGTSGAGQAYTISGTATMLENDEWDLKATTGGTIGVWDDIVITLTIS